ncbi:unnamed protein product, partial [Scytosiphon promiscuus]
MSLREAKLYAKLTELEASANTAQETAAAVLKRAQHAEIILKDTESTIVEHESLDTSLRIQSARLGRKSGWQRERRRCSRRKPKILSNRPRQIRKTQQLLDLCWADFADLTSIMDELASSVAAGTDVSEGSGSLSATLEAGRAQAVHVSRRNCSVTCL